MGEVQISLFSLESKRKERARESRSLSLSLSLSGSLSLSLSLSCTFDLKCLVVEIVIEAITESVCGGKKTLLPSCDISWGGSIYFHSRSFSSRKYICCLCYPVSLPKDTSSSSESRLLLKFLFYNNFIRRLFI